MAAETGLTVRVQHDDSYGARWCTEYNDTTLTGKVRYINNAIREVEIDVPAEETVEGPTKTWYRKRKWYQFWRPRLIEEMERTWEKKTVRRKYWVKVDSLVVIREVEDPDGAREAVIYRKDTL